TSVAVASAERLAGILDDPEAAPRRDALDRVHVGSQAVDVHGRAPAGSLAERRVDPRRVQVQRLRVDVHEDGLCTLVEQAVGRGDEAERRGDDLVAGLYDRRAARPET